MFSCGCSFNDLAPILLSIVSGQEFLTKDKEGKDRYFKNEKGEEGLYI
jgi:hypothetical protein